MGTNYYARPRHGGRKFHIGKMSGGLRFMFHAIAGRHTTYRMWRAILMSGGYRIVNEWREEFTPDEFFEKVDSTTEDDDGVVYAVPTEQSFIDIYGFSMNTGEWD